MRIRGVDFPESLIRAQTENRLVIFAGAGVSIPSPSNYPDFNRLSEQVAGGALSREPNEPTDRFLGRLVDKKIKVHERVRQILSDPSSSANPLHLNLLRLFQSDKSVRLVTTNFDSHFTNAARTILLDKETEVFYAPALPLGNPFQGIAYLHGNVEKSAERLVLTDSDFGRAYLTEGWARRFLQQLFSKYTVLFVGYSHNDIVMEYLARGLPPQTDHPGRFALTIEGSADELWKYRGIQPVSYPKGSEDDVHAPLAQAVAEWAEESRRTPIEHEEKLKTIVQRPLSVDVEDLDYVDASLQDITKVRFFRRFAKRTDWLTWIENKQVFTELFQASRNFSEINAELAQWFAENFVCENSSDGLGVLFRKKQQMGWLLATAIARQLFVQKPRPTLEIGKWIPLLTNSLSANPNGQFLEYLLDQAVFPDDQSVALILFDYLTKPAVLLKKSIWVEVSEGREDVNFELRTEGSEDWLGRTWAKFFRPHLNDFGDRLVWIVYYNLHKADLLLRSTGENNHQRDRLSLHRGMIESASQGTPDDGIGILITAACELIEWSASNRAATLNFLIQAWSSSDSQLLKRLALFGVSKSNWKGDDKLQWLLKQDLLYKYGFKHEVFLLLENAFAKASKRMQTALLNHATRVRKAVRPYEIFNLLYWLTTNAPKCRAAELRFQKFSAKHPKFSPPEHPDMDAWVGPVRNGFPTVLSIGEVKEKKPEELLEFISTFKPGDPLEIHGLMDNIREAASESYDWSKKVVQLLLKRDLWISELWNALISAWRQKGPSVEQWQEIFSFLVSNDKVIDLCLYEVSHLLEDGTKGTEHDIPPAMFSDARIVARKAWAACERSGEKQEEAEDWLFVAINRPAGTLLEFWLRTLSKSRQEMGDQWKGLPSEDERFLSRVVSGESYGAELGRVVVAAQVFFLFSADETWTIQHVIPLFSFRRNLKKALQAWHGYLVWGSWNDRLLVHLLPKYEEAFPFVNSQFGKLRDAFCNHLAGIAAFSKIDPSRSSLYKFLAAVTEQERIRWAAAFGQGLKGMEEPAKTAMWALWLRQYWKDRVEGIPIPLTEKEGEEMVEWSIHLRSVFAEVVANALVTSIPDMQSSFMLTELSQSVLRKEYPKESSALVLHVLKNAHALPWDTRWVEPLVTELASSTESKPNTRLICDELSRLGYQDAQRLKKLAS
jgi:hypothetical protein